MREIWKDVPGWEGSYQISNQGQFKSLKGDVPRILTGHADRKGYRIVFALAGKRRQRFAVHRLVLFVFKGPPPTAKHHCDHINNQPADNRIENLQWVTVQENNKLKETRGRVARGSRLHNSKLNEDAVLFIRERFSPDGEWTVRLLAEKYGVNRETIRRVVARKFWTHV